MGHILRWQKLELNQTKLHSAILRTYNIRKNEMIEIAARSNKNVTYPAEQITDEPMFNDSNGQQLSNHTVLQHLSSALSAPFLGYQRQLATNLSYNVTYADKFNHDDTSPILSDYWMILLIVLYVIIILGGIFGNASLLVTLYTQSSARLRNPLLVALCTADLMVTGISAPITVITVILISKGSFSLTAFICRLISFAQVSQTFNLSSIFRLSRSSIYGSGYVRRRNE